MAEQDMAKSNPICASKPFCASNPFKYTLLPPNARYYRLIGITLFKNAMCRNTQSSTLKGWSKTGWKGTGYSVGSTHK
jgi:hypothetical protein